MDVSFARALRMGTEAVHRADPAALSGIEGVQVPGWGGYDYSLLVQSVDAMEGYDLPLAHSLNPRLTLLSTSFSAEPGDLHNIWQGLLEGGRGLILWDEDYSIVRQDATFGDRGKDYAATFAEIRGPIGSLLLASEPHVDPVAILYSPASFRTQWMLEQKPKGDAWMTRNLRRRSGQCGARCDVGYERAVTHLGLQPAYLPPAMVEEGALRKRGIRTLILPHVIALSATEARAIGDFAALGGRVIADVRPGSVRRTQPAAGAAVLKANRSEFSRPRRSVLNWWVSCRRSVSRPRTTMSPHTYSDMAPRWSSQFSATSRRRRRTRRSL